MAATLVTSTTATINATFNPNGSTTSITFDFGTNTNYGIQDGPYPGYTVAQSVGLPLSQLQANTTYHYRLEATNSAGTTLGNDISFTTPAVQMAPTATTNPASSITVNSATFNSTVNPNGLDTLVHYEWGTTTSYGNSTTPATDISNGFAGIGVATVLQNALPNTTYHYRVVAINSMGTSDGSDVSFTTLSVQAPPTVTTNAATNVALNSATFNGTANPNGLDTTVYFQWGTTTSYGTSTSPFDLGNGATSSPFSANITGALSNKTYHYRAVASNSQGTVYGSDQSFTTPAAQPTATTVAASNLTFNSAQLNATVNPNGFDTSCYFEWGPTTSYGNTTTPGDIGSGGSVQNVQSILSTLQPSTLYHYQVVASNSAGKSYGGDLTFTTPAVAQAAPTAITNPASNVGLNSATFNGTSNPNGLDTMVHFDWGTTTSYGSSTTPADIGGGGVAVNFTGGITGGLPNTPYHYRTVAVNSDGTNYGADQTFTTLAAQPAATTIAASSVTQSSAVLNATVNPEGLDATISFEWGPTAAYGNTTTPSDGKNGGIPESAMATLNGLQPNTVYHFQVIATNSMGTTYGGDLTFTSQAIQLAPPTATTNPATNVGLNSATFNGSSNPNGLDTMVHFDWGLTNAYGNSTTASDIGSGGTIVPFAANVAGALPITTYHYRAVAVNSMGITDGLDQSFTTPAAQPVATSTTASGVTLNSAVLNASVNPNGLDTTISFEWGLTNAYGNTTTPTDGGSGGVLESVNSALTQLQPNTPYHYHVKAVNSDGTTYGLDQSFTTLAAQPTVATVAASNVLLNSAQLNGTVIPNGLDTSTSFQWGTTTSYGNTTTPSDSGSGGTLENVSSTLTQLLPNTTYHYQIKAVNSDGTTYGSDQNFTTPGAAPLVTTNPASGVTLNSAQLNATVNPNGLDATTYFQYGTTTAYGSQTQPGDTGSGGLAVNLQATLNGALPNTTYHYRVVSSNSLGTNYGSDQSFTTLAAQPTATTNAATSITSNSAVLNASVNPNGLDTTTYFEYGTTASYGSNSSTSDIGNGGVAANVTGSATGLLPNTTYHYRVDSSNSDGPTLGNDQTFTTPASAPTVATNPASGIGQTTAQFNATVNPNGLDTTTYFQWGTSPAYGNTTTSTDIGSGTASENINASVTGVVANTIYHYRVVATNNDGSTYGLDQSFSTQAVPQAKPTVTTTPATSITITGATFTGTVNPNGLDTTTYFEYGTTTSYGSQTTSGDSGSGTATENVSAPLTSAAPNTTYHYRLDATNSLGTSYGNDQTFTTQPPAQAVPTVTTNAASLVTSNSAQFNATVNPNGLDTTTYFQYGTTTAYGTSSAPVDNGSGGLAVIVTAPVSQIAPNTTYHYQAVSHNSMGTIYGNDVSFTTLPAAQAVPTVTTNAASSITYNSAQLNATVNPNGLDTTATFEYGLTASYGSQSSSIDAGSGAVPVNVMAVITGALPNTTYHYRVDATNSLGTILGGDVTFMTAPAPLAITSANSTTFTIGQTGSFTVTGTGTPAPTFSATGLPNWASLSPSGLLTGVPPINVTGAPFSVTFTAHNGAMPDVTQAFTLNVSTNLPFTQWEQQPNFFSSTLMNNLAISGPTANPQNDGVPNLLKYLYDINPAQPMGANDQAALPVFGVTNTGDLTLTFREYYLMTGITIHVQTSSDLQNWSPVPLANSPTPGSYTIQPTQPPGNIPPTNDPYMIIDFMPTSPGSRQFIRLNVTQP